MKAIPYYIKDFSKDPNYNSISGGYSKNVYYWNYYDVKLDNDYNVTTIINAVKSGMYESVFSKNYFWSHPHWDVSRNSNINRNTECWDSSFDNALKSSDTRERLRSIIFNCGSDNICTGNLTVKMAMRRDFKTETVSGEDVNLNYVSGIITFCDESSAQTCGNGLREGTEQCDGSDLGGETCISRGFTSGTLKCTAGCMFDTSSCIFQQCGDNIKEGTEQCDGSDLGGAWCGSLGYKAGTLSCKSDCTYNTTSCIPHVCGDSIKGGAEQCDGSDLGGKTCNDFGSLSCPDKCETGKEYRSGSRAGSLQCTSTCKYDTTGCSVCGYASTKTCKYNCKDNLNCWNGKWCPSYGGTPNGCGDTADCLWVICDGCYGNECYTTAGCIREDVSTPAKGLPTCQWTDLYWLCWCGWTPCCCSSTNTCVVPVANCYLTDACKYI